MKRFSLSLFSLMILFSVNSFAKEHNLPLISCPDDSAKYIKVTELENRKIFSSFDTPPLIIKVPKGTHQVLAEDKLKPSRMDEDMTTLKKLTIFVFNNLPVEKTIRGDRQCVSYKQSYLRTDTTITTIDESNSTNTYNFFIGEEDHFYLSAEMPISSIKELYYDEDSNSFIEKEQPASFYFGLNYKLGDISTQYSTSDDFYKNFSLKAIAKIAKHPSESFGVGLGYHLNKNIEFFVARIWTKDNNNVNRERMGYTPTTTYGISFNLTKALSWLGAE